MDMHLMERKKADSLLYSQEEPRDLFNTLELSANDGVELKVEDLLKLERSSVPTTILEKACISACFILLY